MMQVVEFMAIVLINFNFLIIQTFETDEYHCMVSDGIFKNCRRCRLLSELCEKPNQNDAICKCDSIEIYDRNCKEIFYYEIPFDSINIFNIAYSVTIFSK